MSISASPPSAAPQTEGAGRPAARPALERWKNVAGYAAAAGLALAVMAGALRLWHADLRLPLEYGGDSLFMQMLVKNTLDEGWYLDGGRLGAPGVLDLRDFPIPDVLHVAVVKALGLVFRDPVVVLNLNALFPFPLTALSAYFALRRLRLGRLAALVPAVLFACLGYHFLRMKGHQFLAAYYLLPLMFLLVLRVCVGWRPFLRADSGGKPRWRFLSWGAAGAALVCVLTGLAGVYYAFFSCFFLLAAGVKAAFRERQWRPIGVSAILIVLITAALAAALSPTTLHKARYGRNYSVAIRGPFEADLYGLNVSEMLLPGVAHRIAWLAHLRERFLAPPRQPTGERDLEPLGLLASLGFVYLFGRFLWRRPPTPTLPHPRGEGREGGIEDALAYLTAAAVAFGTIGGLGCLFSFSVTAKLRCCNRLSVCIAFFALAGLFLWVQRTAGRFVRGRRSAVVYAAGLLTLLALGALDQTSDAFIPRYGDIRKEYASDADFGRAWRRRCRPGRWSIRCPMFLFPSPAPVENLTDYELLRPFLHTHTLRFSYGAMSGREASRWQADLASRPLPDAVERLAFAGFRGVYLDRAGFADRGAAAEAELARLLGVEPLVSRSGRQAFFDMTAYAEALRGRLTDGEWEEKANAVRK